MILKRNMPPMNDLSKHSSKAINRHTTGEGISLYLSSSKMQGGSFACLTEKSNQVQHEGSLREGDNIPHSSPISKPSFSSCKGKTVDPSLNLSLQTNSPRIDKDKCKEFSLWRMKVMKTS